MFNQAPQDNDIRRVMDACLPGLENSPDFDRDVLRHVRGEIKVKKKLSVGFVLVIVLALAAVTAAGLSTWKDGVVFAILIVVLLLKPTGILGKKMNEKV